MGDRISFRERGEGLSQKTAATGAVSITEPRVRFRKGWLTGGTPITGAVECGDGTDDGFCLPVTMDQLHEIAYRVYDAIFSAGKISFTFGGGAYLEVANIPAAASAKSGTESLAAGDIFFERGHIYGYEDGTTDLSPENDNVLDSVTTFATADIGGTIGFAFRPYKSDRPVAPWVGLPESTFFASLIGTAPPFYTEDNDKHFGFRHVFASEDSGNTSTLYGIWANATPTTYEMFGGLTSSLEVAYTDAEDPYDPAASLYLQILFEVNNPDVGFSTVNYPGTSYHCNLELELAGSVVVSCKIYAAGTTGTPINFRCKANRWWPYETTAGDAAYVTTTGLPDNGGPGA